MLKRATISIKLIEILVQNLKMLDAEHTGSAPSLLGVEPLRPFVRGGATGDEGADFRRNGLRSRFTIL